MLTTFAVWQGHV